MSLQFNLLFKSIIPDSDNEDYDILKDFYKTLVGIDRDRGQKKNRIMNPQDFAFKLSRPPNETAPTRGISCKDDGMNLKFTEKFLNVFEKHKDKAIKVVEKTNKEQINFAEYVLMYPELKKQIMDIANDKTAPACTDLTFGFSDDQDVHWGIGMELFQFASNKLRKKDWGRVFSDDPLMMMNAITCKDSKKIKRHIIQKVATVLNDFEDQKNDEVKELTDKINFLKDVTSSESIKKPYWKEGNDTCYATYHDSLTRGITSQLPVTSQLPWEPTKGWNLVDGSIQHAKIDENGECPLNKEFWSFKNLSNATEKDKDFFEQVGINYEETLERVKGLEKT